MQENGAFLKYHTRLIFLRFIYLNSSTIFRRKNVYLSSLTGNGRDLRAAMIDRQTGTSSIPKLRFATLAVALEIQRPP